MTPDIHPATRFGFPVADCCCAGQLPGVKAGSRCMNVTHGAAGKEHARSAEAGERERKNRRREGSLKQQHNWATSALLRARIDPDD